MPIPDDLAPGRAHEPAQALGRVTVVSASGVGNAVRADRRHVVRHGALGAAVGWWLGEILALAVPFLPGRWVVAGGPDALEGRSLSEARQAGGLATATSSRSRAATSSPGA